jgi:hypothetical protein
MVLIKPGPFKQSFITTYSNLSSKLLNCFALRTLWYETKQLKSSLVILCTEKLLKWMQPKTSVQNLYVASSDNILQA